MVKHFGIMRASSMEFFSIIFALIICILAVGEPEFIGPIQSITASVGRNVEFACSIQDLSPYKVAWINIRTHSILTVHTHVITRSQRINVRHDNNSNWYLQIKNVQVSDAGGYLCQINTDPMKSLTGYLYVFESTTESTTITDTTATASSYQPQKENTEHTITQTQLGSDSAGDLSSSDWSKNSYSTSGVEHQQSAASYLLTGTIAFFSYITSLY